MSIISANSFPEFSDHISSTQREPSVAADRAARSLVVRKRLVSIGRAFQEKAVEVGILLEECQREQYWRSDYASFSEYVETELGISVRTAQDLTRVIRACQAVNITPTEILRLGWSKVSIVASLLTSENASQLIAEVEHKSCRELKQLVRAEKLSGTASNSMTGYEKRRARQRRKILITELFHDALCLACLHTREMGLEPNLRFIATRFVELCPPTSAQSPNDCMN